MRKLTAVCCLFMMLMLSEKALGNDEFSWNMFIPLITSSETLDYDRFTMYEDLEQCFYNHGYWYEGSCHQLEKPIGDGSGEQSRIHLIIDGVNAKYKEGNRISYEGTVSGTVGERYNGVCVGIAVSQAGTGQLTFSQSPWNSYNMPLAPPPNTIPQLLRYTLAFDISGYSSSTISDFFQDDSGRIIVPIDPNGYYHNYPNGTVWIESNLRLGKSWNFKYSALEYGEPLYPGSGWSEYERGDFEGSYTVVAKEVIVVGNSKSYEAFKVQYRYNYKWLLNPFIIEEGYMWIYPKIGVIKGDVNITTGSFGGCTDKLRLIYSMTETNLEPDNLPYRE